MAVMLVAITQDPHEHLPYSHTVSGRARSAEGILADTLLMQDHKLRQLKLGTRGEFEGIDADLIELDYDFGGVVVARPVSPVPNLPPARFP